jgi:hypothetical protein
MKNHPGFCFTVVLIYCHPNPHPATSSLLWQTGFASQYSGNLCFIAEAVLLHSLNGTALIPRLHLFTFRYNLVRVPSATESGLVRMEPCRKLWKSAAEVTALWLTHPSSQHPTSSNMSELLTGSEDPQLTSAAAPSPRRSDLPSTQRDLLRVLWDNERPSRDTRVITTALVHPSPRPLIYHANSPLDLRSLFNRDLGGRGSSSCG